MLHTAPPARMLGSVCGPEASLALSQQYRASHCQWANCLTCCAAHPEEPPRHLLPSPNLSQDSIPQRAQIHLQGLHRGRGQLTACREPGLSQDEAAQNICHNAGLTADCAQCSAGLTTKLKSRARCQHLTFAAHLENCCSICTAEGTLQQVPLRSQAEQGGVQRHAAHAVCCCSDEASSMPVLMHTAMADLPAQLGGFAKACRAPGLLGWVPFPTL